MPYSAFRAAVTAVPVARANGSLTTLVKVDHNPAVYMLRVRDQRHEAAQTPSAANGHADHDARYGRD